MLKNYEFAVNFSLPTDSFYAVAPHHSGVYPTYDELFRQWSNIWHVKATSTEEYPHLNPAHSRRGFIHMGIKVVPRQTCGVFTHTIFKKEYPGGIKKLESMINGGDLFKTTVHNQVLIFMTHMTNYGSDRLGLFVFEELFKFVNKWTNIKLIASTPLKICEKYFEIYPKDAEPQWTNPCQDKRHISMWHLNKTECSNFPKFIILGPQKTGLNCLRFIYVISSIRRLIFQKVQLLCILILTCILS